MDSALDWLDQQFSEPWVLALTIAVSSIFVAYFASFVIRRTLGVLTRRTVTELDDRVLDALKQPIFLSFILYGLSWSLDVIGPPARVHSITFALLQTIAIYVWAGAALKVGRAVLDSVGKRAARGAVIQPRTVPVFDMLSKITVVAMAIYFMFLAWNIDVTAWLASAGIIGIAIGFAAKDTLANFFSGVFILADGPYKIGDVIVLDDGLRGRVTGIGIRSTRVVTRDDVEITIPNAVIGASKIINEAGGPYVKQRIAITVEVAYGSDIDKAREVLLSCAPHDKVADDPVPRVRFAEFGASGLVFRLLVWIPDPETRGEVTDILNSRVYKALAAAGIEIPYSKHDVYIKQMPGD
jgi:small-conductance mechanosensitive channel